MGITSKLMKKKFFLFFTLIMAGLGIFLLTPKTTKPDYSQTLIIAFDSKILSVDPRMIGSDAASQYVEELRFLPLVSFDKQGNLTHVLADQIRFQGEKVFITLKKGIHFANGAEITSADVESTYNAILSPKAGFPPNPRKSLFGELIAVNAQSTYKMVFTLKHADASFINNLVVGILPKIAAETEPIGTLLGKQYESGPFLLKTVNESQWCFAANPNFDYAPKPKLAQFIIKVIPDSTTRYAALIKGDIDLIQNSLDPDKINLIETKMQDAFHVIKGTKLATTYIGFNFRDPIVKQKNVREALAYALDKESILKYRLRSNESPATGMFPQSSYYFNPDLSVPPYKMDVAREILKSSGVNLPVRLTLTVSSSNKTNIEIAKTMAMSLKEAGFDIKVENLENSLFFQHVNRGIIQMWLAPWVGFKDPDHLRFIFATSMFPPAGANRGHYSNPEVDVLLEKGRVEFDPIKRKKIYLKAQELISDDMPYLYLWHGSNVAVTSKRVQGFDVYADGRYWSLVNTSIIAQK